MTGPFQCPNEESTKANAWFGEIVGRPNTAGEAVHNMPIDPLTTPVRCER
jgi:hypothetical protein